MILSEKLNKFGIPLMEDEINNLEEMRTKSLKIDGREIEAVLMAGGSGFKIYSISDGVVLSIGRKNVLFKEADKEFKPIMAYVNLRYQKIEDKPQIEKTFQEILDKHRQ